MGIALALIPPPFTQWALLAWLAIGYMLWPPKLWRWPLTIIAALLGWGVLQTVLPFVGAPKWINTLNSVGIASPSNISIQPATSWLYLWPAITGFFAIWWFVGREYSPRFLTKLLRTMTILLGGLCAIAMVCLMGGFTHPSFDSIGFFSYFANRNQSATLYALTGVLALGMMLMERRAHNKWTGVIVLVVAIVALSLNPSRGGWVSMALGSIFLFWHRKNRFVWISLALLAGVIMVLVVSPQAVNREFSGKGEPVRLSYAKSALAMAADNPMGVGLANFRYVFPHYQQSTALDTIASHPENDWLWLLGEMGWPALALIGALAGIRLDRSKRRLPIVGAAIVAAAIPSLFDVPLHRLGLLIPLLALIGPAWKPNTGAKLPFSRWKRPVAVLTLIALATGSFLYIRHYSSIMSTHQRSYLTQDPIYIQQAFDAAIALEPYNFYHYRKIGNMYLYEGNDPTKANDYMYKALAAHPKLPLIAQQFAFGWGKVNHGKSMALWRESLRRANQEDRPTLFGQTILRATNQDDYDQLAQICSDNPRLWEIFLEDDRALKYIPLAITRQIDLSDLQGHSDIFKRWAATTTLAQGALDYLQANQPTSPAIAIAYATLHSYQKAVEQALATLPDQPIIDRFDYMTLNELRLQIRLQKEPRSSVPFAIALLARAMEANDARLIKEVMAELLDLEQPPVEVLRQRTLEYTAKENWRAAWETISRAL